MKSFIDKELNTDIRLDENCNLELNLKSANDKNVMQYLSYAKLPSIRMVQLNYIEYKINSIIRFIDQSFPDKLDIFYLNYFNDKKGLKIDELVPKLLK